MELTGKQKRHLRALAHHLKPVVLVGAAGVSEALVGHVTDALEDHELIKMKCGENAPLSIKEAAAEVSQATGCAVAGTIGRTAILYKRRAEDPEIELPKA
ncbi:MAG: ribosome assembly RNA-binding protein YhbY [Deltaproteobacteria bacterium]|nr:MAG: ribosome assembly RNA-binding protein YhbY [Deltaproteobacteria bacterium]